MGGAVSGSLNDSTSSGLPEICRGEIGASLAAISFSVSVVQLWAEAFVTTATPKTRGAKVEICFVFSMMDSFFMSRSGISAAEVSAALNNKPGNRHEIISLLYWFVRQTVCKAHKPLLKIVLAVHPHAMDNVGKLNDRFA